MNLSLAEELQDTFAPFGHPGMLQSRSDLIRMRDAVSEKQQLIHGGFEIMRDHP